MAKADYMRTIAQWETWLEKDDAVAAQNEGKPWHEWRFPPAWHVTPSDAIEAYILAAKAEKNPERLTGAYRAFERLRSWYNDGLAAVVWRPGINVDSSDRSFNARRDAFAERLEVLAASITQKGGRAPDIELYNKPTAQALSILKEQCQPVTPQALADIEHRFRRPSIDW